MEKCTIDNQTIMIRIIRDNGSYYQCPKCGHVKYEKVK